MTRLSNDDINQLKSYTEVVTTEDTALVAVSFDYVYGTDGIVVTIDAKDPSTMGYSVTMPNETTVAFNPPVPTGHTIRLQRETDIDKMGYVFTSGALFIASNMDANFEQIRHAQQEVKDSFDFLENNTLGVVEAAKAATDRANEASKKVEDSLEGVGSTTLHNWLSGRDAPSVHPASSISYGGTSVGSFLDSLVYAGKSFVTDDYTTLAQLQANDSQIAFVKAAGISGEFVYKSASTATPNGGTIIASVNGGNWVRLFSSEVQSTWFSSLQNFVNFVTNSAYQGAFEAKTYTLTETLTIPISSGFMLRGAGSDTVFTPATNFAGDTLIRLVGYSRDVEFQIGGFKVTRGANTTVQRGISIGTEDPNISIRGLTYSNLWGISVDSFPTNWAICHARMITFDNCSGWNQPNDTTGENLLIYQKGKFTGDMIFNQCQFVAAYQKNMGVNIQSNNSAYNANNGDNSVCGLSFNDCDIYSGTESFNAYAGNGSYIADIWCDGVQIDQQQDNGFKFVADGVGSLIQDIHINHSYVSKSNNNQIGFIALNGGTIANIWTQSNQIINVLNNGINFYRDTSSTLKDLHVNDNSFPDPNTQSALIEFNGAKKFTCSGNHITEVFGQSTAKTVVNIEQGCENFTVFGNNDDDNTSSGTIIDLSGDVKKAIFGNVGYNPILAQNITVGASPFAYKNTTGSPIVVSVSGGSVSDIKLSSGIGDIHFTPTDNTQVTVPNGKLLTVAYTNAPNMYIYGI